MNENIAVRLKGQLGTFDLNVDFALPMHGISALFGPSGCGKTSILRSIAGLNRISGAVSVGADIWQDETTFLPTHKRPIGYVFQEASLFPHLNVRNNMSYGMRRSKSKEHVIRFDEIVDLLGLSHLVERTPTHLSGGERQRVSLARALLTQPRLLLMDEPLSALDAMAKQEILPYFETLHANLKIPIILVTHDITEVERLADHIVLMRNGQVVTSGSLDNVLSAPDSPLASRRDFASILEGRVLSIEEDGIATVDVGGTRFHCLAQRLAIGDAVRVRIAAGDVSIARPPVAASSILNTLPVEVLSVETFSDHERSVLLNLENGGGQFRARISVRSAIALGLKTGDRVVAQVKGMAVSATR